MHTGLVSRSEHEEDGDDGVAAKLGYHNSWSREILQDEAGVPVDKRLKDTLDIGAVLHLCLRLGSRGLR